VIFVVRSSDPEARVHVVDEKKLNRARCDEDLKDSLEVPRVEVRAHPFCPKCLEALI
jgi:hypothetical protein